MIKRVILITTLLAVLVLVAGGCSERTTSDNRPDINPGAVSEKNHVFYDELLLQVQNKAQLITYTYYYPDTIFDFNNDLPVLVLLPPSGFDGSFYTKHGLGELAAELIATGEIEPMMIVSLPNRSPFGTFFFAGDSHGGGNWDDILATSLIEHLEESFPGVITAGDPSQRGIGGIGTGAYGAFRAAMLSGGAYGSVSGVDGPLDFDGGYQGNQGLLDLMDDAVAEQADISAATWASSFDTSSTNPISRLFCGGGMAFTQHDQDLDSLIEINNRLNADGSYTKVITIDGDLRGTSLHILTSDSSALITGVIKADNYDQDFHLPFTYDTQPYTPIWNIWMENDLAALLSTGSLTGMDIWIGTSEEASYGFHEMTMSWYQYISGYNPVLYRYVGFDGKPATSSQYTYDLLREMLIFHSNSFQQ